MVNEMEKILDKCEQKNFLVIPFILLILVMFILPFYSAESYTIIKNTTSQLGAQQTKNAWVMNVIFIALGTACILDSLSHFRRFLFLMILLCVFGLTLFLTGIFRHAPIDPLLSYDAYEDTLHSLFATITGTSFTVFAISSSFIEKKIRNRLIDISVGIFATVFSILMGTTPEFSGIWQRMIFLVSFLWLIVIIKRVRLLSNNLSSE